ncbi:hypothetical protein FACS1894130_09840 [Spirochaetia bacterium]|nr:hypothetical protein FACS1894130_09840 [Spirochaetia bacterium]
MMKKKAAFIGLTLALIMSTGLVNTGLRVYAEDVPPPSPAWTRVSTNLISDGGFDSVTAANTGKWVFKKGNVDAEKPGNIAITEGAETEEGAKNGAWGNAGKSITLSAAASSDDAPEIYQVITVEKNTDYHFSFRLRNNQLLISGQNLYFGFSSEDYDSGIDYTQQHKWVDTSTNHNWAGTNEEFTLVTGKFNSGNRTSLRAFIRVVKMNATVDDVIISKAERIIPPGSTNLLQYPGFEGTDVENKSAWQYSTNDATAVELYGFDDVRSTAVYQPGISMQDKQIEGFRTAYFGIYASDHEAWPTLKQAVTVEKNSYYSFYAYISGWGSVWGAWLGIADENGNDIDNAWTYLSYGDFSCARYILVSVSVYTGDRTVVYPYVKGDIGTPSGEWGSGVYVDDTAFFKTSGDVPPGKINLVRNGDFANYGWDDVAGNWKGWNADGWYKNSWRTWTNFYDDNFWGENKVYDPKKVAYASPGNAVFDYDYNAYKSISQEVTLAQDKLYKLTVRARGLYHDNWKQERPGDDDSWFIYDQVRYNYPVVISIKDTSGKDVKREEYRIEHDLAYIPLGLIFTSGAVGTYTVTIAVEGGANIEEWNSGRISIGAVALYEVTEAEITPPSQNDGGLFTVNPDITLSGGALTLAKALKVSELLAGFQVLEGNSLKVVNAAGAQVAAGKYVETGHKLVLSDGTGFEYTYTITAAGGKPSNTGLIIGICAAVLAIAACAIYFLVIRKKK